MIVCTNDRVLLGESRLERLSLEEAKCLVLAAAGASLDSLISSGITEGMLHGLMARDLLVTAPGATGHIWWDYGWERAWDFMAAVSDGRAMLCRGLANNACGADGGTSGHALAPDEVGTMMQRRSYRLFEPDAVPGEIADALLGTIASFGPQKFDVYLVVQAIDGLNHGSYRLESGSREWRFVNEVSPDDLLDVAQGMWWVGGGGGVLFICSTGAATPFRYYEALLAIGRLGQRLLFDIYRAGLGAWQTPALNEEKAAALLRVRTSEPLELIKFGRPRPDERVAYGLARDIR